MPHDPVTHGQFQAFQTRLFDHLDEHSRQFRQIDERFDGIDARLDQMNSRFDDAYNRFIRLEQRIGT